MPFSSTTWTVRPCRASRLAATSPLWPAPTMSTSGGCWAATAAVENDRTQGAAPAAELQVTEPPRVDARPLQAAWRALCSLARATMWRVSPIEGCCLEALAGLGAMLGRWPLIAIEIGGARSGSGTTRRGAVWRANLLPPPLGSPMQCQALLCSPIVWGFCGTLSPQSQPSQHQARRHQGYRASRRPTLCPQASSGELRARGSRAACHAVAVSGRRAARQSASSGRGRPQRREPL